MLNDAFGQCNWYLLPIEMQQMMLIVVVNAQQPTIVRGFGNTSCGRQSFKQVGDAHAFDSATLDHRKKWFFSISDIEWKLLLFHDDAQNYRLRTIDPTRKSDMHI